MGEGFEPSKLAQQIYSLPPLTAREPHQRRKGNPNQAFGACQAFLAHLQKISSAIAGPGRRPQTARRSSLSLFFWGKLCARTEKSRFERPAACARPATGSGFKTEPPASTQPVPNFGNAGKLNALGATERKRPGAGLAPKWLTARPGCGRAAPTQLTRLTYGQSKTDRARSSRNEPGSGRGHEMNRFAVAFRLSSATRGRFSEDPQAQPTTASAVWLFRGGGLLRGFDGARRMGRSGGAPGGGEGGDGVRLKNN